VLHVAGPSKGSNLLPYPLWIRKLAAEHTSTATSGGYSLAIAASMRRYVKKPVTSETLAEFINQWSYLIVLLG
jgi:hypothetical protein